MSIQKEVIKKLKDKFPTLEEALKEITRLLSPIKGHNFWVKTVQIEQEGKKTPETEVSLFRNLEKAVMSYETMEKAIRQRMSIAEFKYNPNPDEEKGEVAWTITPIPQWDIAGIRIEISEKQEDEK